MFSKLMASIQISVKFIWISQLHKLFESVKVYIGPKPGTVLNSPGSCEYHGTIKLNVSYQSFSKKNTQNEKIVVKHNGKLNAFIVQFTPIESENTLSLWSIWKS